MRPGRRNHRISGLLLRPGLRLRVDIAHQWPLTASELDPDSRRGQAAADEQAPAVEELAEEPNDAIELAGFARLLKGIPEVGA